jgi:hypothetical protein
MPRNLLFEDIIGVSLSLIPNPTKIIPKEIANTHKESYFFVLSAIAQSRKYPNT